MRIDGGEKDGNEEVDARSKKAIQLIKLTKQYKELAMTARDAGELLGRRTEISWSNGDEDSV